VVEVDPSVEVRALVEVEVAVGAEVQEQTTISSSTVPTAAPSLSLARNTGKPPSTLPVYLPAKYMSGRSESITVARISGSSTSVKQVPEPILVHFVQRVSPLHRLCIGRSHRASTKRGRWSMNPVVGHPEGVVLDSFEQRLDHPPEKDVERLHRRVLLAGLLGRVCITLILLTTQCLGALLFALSAIRGGNWAFFGFIGFWLLLLSPWRLLAYLRPDPAVGNGVSVDLGDKAREFLRCAISKGGARSDSRLRPLVFVDDGLTIQFPGVGYSRRTGTTVYIVQLGLPVIMALSAHELECVVVNGAARLRGLHMPSMRWASLMFSLPRRLSWIQNPPGRHAPIAAVLGYRLYRPMFSALFAWYLPWLAKRTLALSKTIDAAADRTVAELYGDSALADCRTVIASVSTFLGTEYWRRVAEIVGDDIDALHPFTDMEVLVSNRAAAARGHEVTSAARELLGDRIAEIAAELDDWWRWHNANELLSLGRERQRNERALEELTTQGAEDRLSPEETWRVAAATERTAGPKAAEPLYEDLVDDEVVGAKAQFRLGRLLLLQEDEAGLSYLRRVAFSDDSDLALAAASEASGYLRGMGRELEAQPFRSRAMELQKLLAPVHEERSDVQPRDRFLPHGLGAEIVAEIREELRHGPRLWRAYLVQKQVKINPERPAYVLGLMTEDCFIHRVNFQNLKDAVRFAQLQIELPETCLIVGLYHDKHTKIIRGMRRVKGSRVL
jgi:hypothetical protein